jgi:hypothetical protein
MCQTYVVQMGENINVIASKLSIDPTIMASLNNVTVNAALAAGEVLKLPPWSAECPQPMPTATSALQGCDTYVVQEALKISVVATLLNSSLNDLMAINGINSTSQVIPAGTRLKIPPNGPSCPVLATAPEASSPLHTIASRITSYVQLKINATAINVKSTGSTGQIATWLSTYVGVVPSSVNVSIFPWPTAGLQGKRVLLQQASNLSNTMSPVEILCKITTSDPQGVYAKAKSSLENGQLSSTFSSLGWQASGNVLLSTYQNGSLVQQSSVAITSTFKQTAGGSLALDSFTCTLFTSVLVLLFLI